MNKDLYLTTKSTSSTSKKVKAQTLTKPASLQSKSPKTSSSAFKVSGPLPLSDTMSVSQIYTSVLQTKKSKSPAPSQKTKTSKP